MMSISVSVEKGIEKIKNVEGFGKVKFIILYGSAAEDRMIKLWLR